MTVPLKEEELKRFMSSFEPVSDARHQNDLKHILNMHLMMDKERKHEEVIEKLKENISNDRNILKKIQANKKRESKFSKKCSKYFRKISKETHIIHYKAMDQCNNVRNNSDRKSFRKEIIMEGFKVNRVANVLKCLGFSYHEREGELRYRKGTGDEVIEIYYPCGKLLEMEKRIGNNLKKDLGILKTIINLSREINDIEHKNKYPRLSYNRELKKSYLNLTRKIRDEASRINIRPISTIKHLLKIGFYSLMKLIRIWQHANITCDIKKINDKIEYLCHKREKIANSTSLHILEAYNTVLKTIEEAEKIDILKTNNEKKENWLALDDLDQALVVGVLKQIGFRDNRCKHAMVRKLVRDNKEIEIGYKYSLSN